MKKVSPPEQSATEKHTTEILENQSDISQASIMPEMPNKHKKRVSPTTREVVENEAKIIRKMIDLVQSLPAAPLREVNYFRTRVKRDEDMRDLLTGLERNYSNFQGAQGLSQQNWLAFRTFEGSGSGKTYFTFNLYSFLADYWTDYPNEFPNLKNAFEAARILRVYSKEMNGTKMPDNEDPKFFLLVTMAACLMHGKQKMEDLESVSKVALIQIIDQFKMRQHFANPTLVMKCIRQVQQITKEQTWILFGHDELQNLLSPEQVKLTEQPVDTKKTVLYKYITGAMQLSTDPIMYNQNIFLVNTFSGTFPLHLTNALIATNYTFFKVGLRPLTPSQGILLIQQQWTTTPPTFLSEPAFQKLIELCGNIPRIWALVHARIKDLTRLSSKTVMEILRLLCQDVQTMYSLSSLWRDSEFDCAVLATLRRWTLREAPENIQQNLQSMLFAGVIFLGIDDIIFVPIIFLYDHATYANRNNENHLLYKKLFVDMMEKAILGGFNFADFEEFVLSFYCLQYNLLLQFHDSNYTVQKFFRGAIMSQRLGAQRIPIRGTIMNYENGIGDNIAKLRTKGPFASSINCLNNNNSFSIHLGKNDTFCDGIITIRGEYCFGFESKYTESPEAKKGLNGNDVNGFKHEKMRYFDSSLKLEKNIFIYITNSTVGKLHHLNRATELASQVEELKHQHDEAPWGSKTPIKKNLVSLEGKLETSRKIVSEIFELLGDNSVLIHAGNWNEVFPNTFIFLNKAAFVETDQDGESENQDAVSDPLL